MAFPTVTRALRRSRVVLGAAPRTLRKTSGVSVVLLLMFFSGSTGIGESAFGANLPPTVSLTGPIAGDAFSAPATITLTATASDSDGAIAQVTFFQGTTLLKQVNKPPYRFVWQQVAVGSYLLTAKATDKAGASTVSTAVAITVTNSPPMINLTAPISGAMFAAPATITLTATASDSDGTVTNVKFFQGTTLLRQVAKAPYTFVWKAVAAGTYSVTAQATDNAGAVTKSAAVPLSVTGPNTPPIVSLTAPKDGGSFSAFATIALTATASDLDGTIAKVEFFQAGTLLGQATMAPYGVSWPNVPAGTYSLTAQATDNVGAVTTSAAVAMSVKVLTSAGPISYVYDRLSRLIAVIDPASDTAVYQYDAVGNLLSITRHSTASLAIITFSPPSGPIGRTVIISGTGFSSTLSENTVTFSGIPAVVTSNAPLKLVVQVPSGATTGPIQVVTPTGSATSASSFSVTP